MAGYVNQRLKDCAKFQEDARYFKNTYDVGKSLGEGGFGKVFAATCKKSGQRVAIKFVNKAKWIKSEPVSLVRFLV